MCPHSFLHRGPGTGFSKGSMDEMEHIDAQQSSSSWSPLRQRRQNLSGRGKAVVQKPAAERAAPLIVGRGGGEARHTETPCFFVVSCVV